MARIAHGVHAIIGKQFVYGNPCLAGNAFKQRRRRPVDTVHEIGNRRLAHPNVFCKSRLGHPLALKPDSECFHLGPWVEGFMESDSIGFAYQNAIGQSYPQPVHNSGMTKRQERSFLDRAMEALAERYPRDKPTQRRLAQLAGVQQPSVHEWGSPDRGGPNISNAIRLAKALGVCVEWLYTERGPKRPGAGPKPDDDLSPILEAWPDLAPDLRHQVARYTDFIKGDIKPK